jgi:hypothetical protein
VITHRRPHRYGAFAVDDKSLDQWLNEYRRLSSELLKVRLRYRWKEDGRGAWKVPPTPEEEQFDALSNFYNAALMNNGAVFSYTPFMVEHRQAFEAIGAQGCLAALSRFAPIFERYRFETKDQEDDYWREHQAEIAAVEALVDDANEFARLLLAYAVNNAARIG